MAKRSAKSKGFRRQTVKKPYLTKKDIAIVCVIAALLAVAAFFLFRYDDGALKVQDGAVVTDGDNWLIADGSNVRGRSRYFRLGEIGEIEGYSREKRAIAGDANVPEYVYTPSESDADTTVTVTCGHGSAEAVAKYTHGTLEGIGITDAGEIQTAGMAGREVRYYSYATDYTAQADAGEEAEAEEAAAEEAAAEEAATEEAGAADQDARYTRSMAGYIDASHDCCVIVNAVSRGDTDDDCLPDEALADLLERAVAAIALDQE